MLELANFDQEEKNDSTPEDHRVKKLNNITFLGLFNSFNSAHDTLSKLKEQGSIDILAVKKDLTRAKEQVFQIYVAIDAILNSYKNGFDITEEAIKCDFCPDKAIKVQSFHSWCEDCYNREFGI